MKPACCPIAMTINPKTTAPSENRRYFFPESELEDHGQAQHVMYVKRRKPNPAIPAFFLAALHIHL